MVIDREDIVMQEPTPEKWKCRLWSPLHLQQCREQNLVPRGRSVNALPLGRISNLFLPLMLRQDLARLPRLAWNFKSSSLILSAGAVGT